MKMLKLPNIKHTYFPVRNDYRYEIYYNCFTNNMIVFSAIDDYMGVDTETISNLTKDKYYKYLANELNEKQGLLVHWTQDKFDVVKYTIYFDFDPKDLLDDKYEGLLIKLRESKGNLVNGEYTLVIDGVENVIE